MEGVVSVLAVPLAPLPVSGDELGGVTLDEASGVGTAEPEGQ